MRATVAGLIAGVVFSVGFAGSSIAGPAQTAVQEQAAGQIESNVHKTFGWCDRGYRGAAVYGWRSRPRVYGWRSRPRVYGYRRYSPRVYGWRSRRPGVRVYGWSSRPRVRSWRRRW